MAGITPGTMFGFRLHAVPVLLIMTHAAIHCSGSFYSFVAFVSYIRMTVLTCGFTTMNGCLKFSHGNMKHALTAPLLMTSDTILGRVCPGINSRKEYKQSQKRTERVFHKTMLNHSLIPSADYPTSHPTIHPYVQSAIDNHQSIDFFISFRRDIKRGRTECRSPTTPRSAKRKILAWGSVLMAITV